MELDVIRTQAGFEAVAEEWNALLAKSASIVPFLRHEYLLAWWQSRGGGEWPASAELCVVTGRAGGELVGAAPLFFASNRQGEPALLLLGSIEISDYLDVLAAPAHLERFLAGLCELLDSPRLPPWQVLDWYNLLDSSATLAALEAASRRCGWTFSLAPLQHCPYIPLPGDWEQYLGSIDKKQRHEIRRKMRRASEHPQPTRWYQVTTTAGLETEGPAFLDLMAHDPEKAAFLTPAMRAQMLAAMQAAAQAGWLQLAFFEVAGEKAAAYLNFDFANHIWIYNSGYNPAFGELSAGWVLLGHLLQWANEQGRARFDFMRGDEDYKYRFGAVDRRVVRATVRRAAGPAGR